MPAAVARRFQHRQADGHTLCLVDQGFRSIESQVINDINQQQRGAR
jgi:hypothetical protein